MPWCETCSRWFSPNALTPDGNCPSCGRSLAGAPADGEEDEDEAPKIPWHFWVLVGAAVIYLTWRAVQGIVWLVGRM